VGLGKSDGEASVVLVRVRNYWRPFAVLGLTQTSSAGRRSCQSNYSISDKLLLLYIYHH